jgi:hypothetical protein
MKRGCLITNPILETSFEFSMKPFAINFRLMLTCVLKIPAQKLNKLNVKIIF